MGFIVDDKIMEKFTLANNIQKLTKHTSLRGLAKAAGIPSSSLANWSAGQVPSGAKGLSGLKKLSVYLKCSIETLLYGDISAPTKQFSLNDIMEGDVFSGKFLIELKVKKLPDNQ
jgi:hypothetical protein